MEETLTDWKLVEETKRTKHFENNEQYLTLVPAGNGTFHIIIEDTTVPTDVENLMFQSREDVIEILKFDPWNDEKIS